MAKKQSSKPDETGGAPDVPFEAATTDAASTITEPLALPAPEAEPAKAGTTNTEADEGVRAPVKGGARKLSLNQARALHAASILRSKTAKDEKHLPSV